MSNYETAFISLYYLVEKRTKTYSIMLIKKTVYNIQLKRSMHRSTVFVRNAQNIAQQTWVTPSRSFTRSAVRLKNQAAKDVANDDTGKHTHVTQNYCVLKGCENKSCPSLCDQPDGCDVKGHNTHKPPIGRITRFVADHDANGNSKTQYFVKTNKKTTITEKEKQKYGKDIKDDPNQTTFVQNHHDKYD